MDYPKLDIYHRDLVLQSLKIVKPDIIIHLAAESHVCRSIEGPRAFLNANVVGTFNLLEACRETGFKGIFHHVSTDEVFGELSHDESRFDPETAYDPRSPYAASKAASDHFVQAYHHTFGLDTRMTNCSNNFGPNQHEEKLIPKTILNILADKPVTIYGRGTQVRDWIWVDDHCDGIIAAIEKGKPGGRYLLGGEREFANLAIVEEVAAAIGRFTSGHRTHVANYTIEHTNDRPTDDERYAIDTRHARDALDWKPYPMAFRHRLDQVVRWYIDQVNSGRV